MKIEPSHGWALPRLKEIWEYRELVYFLAWRDIKVRYKQTVLGGAWAVIQPFMTMIVFTVFFGILAKVPSDGVPYPVFAYTALVPWTYFANSLTQASNSTVFARGLVDKVYFPRVILPVAAMVSGLVDFAIAFVVLLGLLLYYGMFPTLSNLLLLPALMLFAIITSLGVGLWLSTLNVLYRDVAFVAPFILQFWLFATPVAYSSSLVPARWRVLYGINPMTGVVQGFRGALLGIGTTGFDPMLLVSVAISLLLLVTGLIYFRNYERTFADFV